MVSEWTSLLTSCQILPGVLGQDVDGEVHVAEHADGPSDTQRKLGDFHSPDQGFRYISHPVRYSLTSIRHAEHAGSAAQEEPGTGRSIPR